MSTVLVTGGAGFIGAHTIVRLAADGFDPVAVDPLRTYSYALEPMHWQMLLYRREELLRNTPVILGTTEYRDDIRAVMLEVRPRYVVHLGALPLATLAKGSTDHAFESIARGTLNVLEATREVGTVEKFLYVSSSMVYGDFSQSPMPETVEPQPKEMYGAMKYVGEVMTKTFTRTTGIPHVIVRPSAVYGPTDLNGRIVQKLVEAACWARPITLVNPETTLLDFTYVADVAQGLSRALAAPVENETFNITNGHARSLADLHDLLRAHFPDLEAEVVERTEDFRPRRGTLDVSKARELLGYEPEWSLEAGIETYLEFMRSLPAPAREPVAETSS